jgi:hypothetical protein
MPRQLDQLPTDPTTLARKIAAELDDGEAGFQTNSADGTRYARLESGELTFGSPDVEQASPTGISARTDGATLDLTSGFISGGAPQARIILAGGDSPWSVAAAAR